MRKVVAVVVAFAALVSCGFPKAGPAPGPIQPSAASAAAQRWPGTTTADLERGHELFIAKCNGCHDYPDLHSIAENRWPDVMTKMSAKAQLSRAESKDVLHFVLAAREK